MFVCSIPLLSALFTACSPAPPFATGYVEGEYVLIAPVTTAQVDHLAVRRGDRVTVGQPLVLLEKRDAEIAVAQAQAAVARAQSELGNLQEGRRPEEISVIEATLASVRAQSAEADRAEARLTSLSSRGAATEAQREDAATAADIARAKVAEVEANLAVARLPARAQEIAATEAGLAGAKADLDRAEWLLAKRELVAPSDGTITDVIRNAGEVAGPAAPVLTLLPKGGVKLRLYVPEADVARIAPGSLLQVHCDGCANDLVARVSYISDGPEFTPPVIYSLENRQKLVFLIEAEPVGDTGLKPGQIVDVALSEPGP